VINIYFNDESQQIKSQSLHEFLVHKNHLNFHFAIAINNQFIPRTAYSTTVLYESDRVDIIVPMQGG
jgi:sulfur carrier protein